MKCQRKYTHSTSLIHSSLTQSLCVLFSLTLTCSLHSHFFHSTSRIFIAYTDIYMTHSLICISLCVYNVHAKKIHPTWNQLHAKLALIKQHTAVQTHYFNQTTTQSIFFSLSQFHTRDVLVVCLLYPKRTKNFTTPASASEKKKNFNASQHWLTKFFL